MTIAGVITEYNPFHLGHAYQLQTIKQEGLADYTVVLMSGNVVQRGEFAVLDKWTRSHAAILNGADLVLELPLIASLQSADYFADWSVKILDSLSIDRLVFGTESLESDDLLAYVDWLEEHQEEVDDLVRHYLSQGFSYAASYQFAVETAGGLQFKRIGQANHLLAVQYIQSLRRLNSSASIHALPRIKQLNETQTVYSGSQLRAMLKSNSLEEQMLPSYTYQQLLENPLIDNVDYFPYLKYQIESQSPQRLTRYFGVDHGLETFIFEVASAAEDYSGLINQLTSKRWTKASIQRKLMTILLNITKEEWEASHQLNSQRSAIRVLAYNQKGKEILRQQRDNTKLDLFSNLKQNIATTYELNLRADKVYAQCHPSSFIKEQNTGRFPIQG